MTLDVTEFREYIPFELIHLVGNRDALCVRRINAIYPNKKERAALIVTCDAIILVDAFDGTVKRNTPFQAVHFFGVADRFFTLQSPLEADLMYELAPFPENADVSVQPVMHLMNHLFHHHALAEFTRINGKDVTELSFLISKEMIYGLVLAPKTGDGAVPFGPNAITEDISLPRTKRTLMESTRPAVFHLSRNAITFQMANPFVTLSIPRFQRGESGGMGREWISFFASSLPTRSVSASLPLSSLASTRLVSDLRVAWHTEGAAFQMLYSKLHKSSPPLAHVSLEAGGKRLDVPLGFWNAFRLCWAERYGYRLALECLGRQHVLDFVPACFVAFMKDSPSWDPSPPPPLQGMDVQVRVLCLLDETRESLSFSQRQWACLVSSWNAAKIIC